MPLKNLISIRRFAGLTRYCIAMKLNSHLGQVSTVTCKNKYRERQRAKRTKENWNVLKVSLCCRVLKVFSFNLSCPGPLPFGLG